MTEHKSMLQRLSWSITGLLERRQVIEAEEGEVYAFGFECMLSDALQYLILLAVGLALGRLLPLALMVGAILCVKRHIGGWHANTHFLCILATTTTTVGLTLLCGLAPRGAALAMTAVSAALIFRLAPVNHVNNPKTPQETAAHRKRALRATAALAVAVWGLYLSPLGHLSIYVAGGLFWSAISLLFPSMAVPVEETTAA